MTEEPPGNSVYGYMTEAQLREYYGGVAASTIRRWRKTGVIPEGIKVGGRRLHRKSDHIKSEHAA